MDKEITIYTIITNDYDDLEELSFKEEGIRYIVYTDNPELRSDSWEVIYVEGINHKEFKCLPPFKNISLYLDANIVIKKPLMPLIREFIDSNKIFGLYSAVDNQCAYLEANKCLLAKYDTEERIRNIKEYLKSEGYPENNGMIPGCFILRRPCEEITKQGELWYYMISNYSHRDQISFNYTLWKLGLEQEVYTFPNNVYDDDYINWKRIHKR
jgi:hypothetical protein